MKIYTIYDSKAEFYRSVFLAKSHGEALRMITDEAQSQGSQLGAHPNDFTVFYIGDFNDQGGRITPTEANVNLGLITEHLDALRPELPQDIFTELEEQETAEPN